MAALVACTQYGVQMMCDGSAGPTWWGMSFYTLLRCFAADFRGMDTLFCFVAGFIRIG